MASLPSKRSKLQNDIFAAWNSKAEDFKFGNWEERGINFGLVFGFLEEQFRFKNRSPWVNQCWKMDYIFLKHKSYPIINWNYI